MDKFSPPPFLAPPHFLAKAKERTVSDPIYRQVFPVREEGLRQPHEKGDPVGDEMSLVTELLLQKYTGRALLLINRSCPISCRFCFRRDSAVLKNGFDEGELEKALSKLAQMDDVSELILSGGEPLTAPLARISRAVDAAAEAAHIRSLRIHTRGPVILPMQNLETPINVLGKFPGNKILVTHVNHAAELDEGSKEVFAALRNKNFLLLSQTVLLKGINDSSLILSDLFIKLFDQGVLPYYLHQLDPAPGTSHFRVEISRGREICRRLTERLPGYLVPRYVEEKAGRAGKLRLF